MPVEFKPKIKCDFGIRGGDPEDCPKECPIYTCRDGTPKLLGEPIWSEAWKASSSVYHFKNTTVFEQSSPGIHDVKLCKYYVIAEGPEAEEVINKIKKRIKSWPLIEITE